MSDENPQTDGQTIKNLGRRTLMRSSALLPAAAAVAASAGITGIRPAFADEPAPSADAKAPAAGKTQSPALTDRETWAGSLVLQAAT
jgi:hypothetical protein